MSASINITGNLVEDEGLGLNPSGSEVSGTPPEDNNVSLSNFQSNIPSSSSLGTELTNLGIYPTPTNAIGIASNGIVSASGVQSLQLTLSSNGVDTGFK